MNKTKIISVKKICIICALILFISGCGSMRSDEDMITDRINTFLTDYNNGDIESAIDSFDAKRRNTFSSALGIGDALISGFTGFDVSMADMFGLGVGLFANDYDMMTLSDDVVIKIKGENKDRAEVYATLNLEMAGHQDSGRICFYMTKENGDWYISDIKEGVEAEEEDGDTEEAEAEEDGDEEIEDEPEEEIEDEEEELIPVSLEIKENISGEIGKTENIDCNIEFNNLEKSSEKQAKKIIDSIKWEVESNVDSEKKDIVRIKTGDIEAVNENNVIFNINIEFINTGDVTVTGYASEDVSGSFKCKSNYFVTGIHTNQFEHDVPYFYHGKKINSDESEYNDYIEKPETEFLYKFYKSVFVVDSEIEKSGAIYSMNPDYYQKLMSGELPWKKKELAGHILERWEGSCTGLAMSMVLNSYGKELPGVEKTFWDSKAPVNSNLILRSTINFYHMLQFKENVFATKRYHKEGIFSKFGTSIEDFLDALIEEAEKSEREKKAFLLGYFYKYYNEDSSLSSSGGHEIVVCGINRKNQDTYCLKVYDPNSYNAPESDDKKINAYDINYLEFEINKKTHQFQFTDALGDTLDNDSCYELVYTGIDKIEDKIMYLADNNQQPKIVPLADTSDDEHAELHVSSYAKCRITNDKGQYLECNGTDYTGSMVIYGVKACGEGRNTELIFKVDKSDNFEMSDFDSDVSFAANIGDNYYSSDVSGANSIVLSKNEGIVIDSDKPYYFSSTIGSDMASCDVASISGETSGRSQVAEGDRGVDFTSENECTDTNVRTMKEGNIEADEFAEGVSKIALSDDEDGKLNVDSDSQLVNTYKGTLDGGEEAGAEAGSDIDNTTLIIIIVTVLLIILIVVIVIICVVMSGKNKGNRNNNSNGNNSSNGGGGKIDNDTHMAQNIGRIQGIFGGRTQDICTIKPGMVCTLGRDASCNITINHNKLSRLHCEIGYSANGEYNVTDRSSNGTFHNGQRLPKGVTVTLSAGSEIVIIEGEIVIRLM